MSKSKINPNARNGLVQARVNNAEMKIVHDKAVVYHGGDVSKFTREAVLKYRPLKRVAK